MTTRTEQPSVALDQEVPAVGEREQIDALLGRRRRVLTREDLQAIADQINDPEYVRSMKAHGREHVEVGRFTVNAAAVTAAQDALGCKVYAIHPDSVAQPVRACAEHGVTFGPDEPCPVAGRVARAVPAAAVAILEAHLSDPEQCQAYEAGGSR